MPAGWSKEGADFVNKCIQRKPQSRIGYKNGIAELKAHPWFERYEFDWEQLESRQMQATYMPDTTQENFDSNHVNNSEWKDAEAVAETELQLRRDSIQALF